MNVIIALQKGLYIKSKDLFPDNTEFVLTAVEKDNEGDTILTYDVTAVDKDEATKLLESRVGVMGFVFL